MGEMGHDRCSRNHPGYPTSTGRDRREIRAMVDASRYRAAPPRSYVGPSIGQPLALERGAVSVVLFPTSPRRYLLPIQAPSHTHLHVRPVITYAADNLHCRQPHCAMQRAAATEDIGEDRLSESGSCSPTISHLETHRDEGFHTSKRRLVVLYDPDSFSRAATGRRSSSSTVARVPLRRKPWPSTVFTPTRRRPTSTDTAVPLYQSVGRLDGAPYAQIIRPLPSLPDSTASLALSLRRPATVTPSMKGNSISDTSCRHCSTTKPTASHTLLRPHVGYETHPWLRTAMLGSSLSSLAVCSLSDGCGRHRVGTDGLGREWAGAPASVGSSCAGNCVSCPDYRSTPSYSTRCYRRLAFTPNHSSAVVVVGRIGSSGMATFSSHPLARRVAALRVEKAGWTRDGGGL
uniref:Uncharacterized protein n=1 Tax=Mycena chlorophos TaxID=658473 RepID=A0ABQ0LCS8_MYCCL|nr:predicted protein [Mycena chlorophos]